MIANADARLEEAKKAEADAQAARESGQSLEDAAATAGVTRHALKQWRMKGQV